MQIVATCIQWDTDGDEELKEELPKEIKISPNVYNNGIEAISDYISNETGFCHEGFVVENVDDTKLYLVNFKYISDTSTHSCNIPDEICGQCILEVEGTLGNIEEYKLKSLYEVQELYDSFDADGISFEELSIEDYLNEEYCTEIEEQYYISASRVKEIKL